jgi:hypothetical protein
MPQHFLQELDCGAVKAGELRNILRGEEFKRRANQEREKRTKGGQSN